MAKLALNGGPQEKTKPFPEWPIYDDSERQGLLEVLESKQWWRGSGDRTAQFEQEFADFHGAKYGIAVTNGTHSIEICIAALGIRPGDEVIVPDSTFIGSASPILAAGALPVLVDVDPTSYNVDPAKVEAAITPKTRAIIAVHMGGYPADLDKLVEISKKHNIPLIEDCAHAHASEWRGQRVGTFGIAGSFSFQASKTMTAGEGGIIITSDPEFERKARSIQDCGRLPGYHFYEHFDYASNYRMSEWQSAVLSAQLKRLDEQTKLRDHNARVLDDLLGHIEGLTPQHDPVDNSRMTRNGHYLYLFHYDRTAFNNLPTAKFIEALNAEGIPTQATYPPLSALTVFKDGVYKHRLPASEQGDDALRNQPFPASKLVLEEVVCIPQRALLGDEDDMREIAAAVEKIQHFANEIS